MAQTAAIQTFAPIRIERGNVLQLLDKIAPLIGLKPGPLHTLRAMIEHTPPRDWTNPTGEPICYREQIKIARAARRSERSIRAHEGIFERLGLTEKRTRGDGARGRFSEQAIMGISFRPLIERLDELLALSEQAEASDRRCAALRPLISSARRSLTKTLSAVLTIAPKHPELPTLLRLQENLPRRYEGYTLDQLEELYSLVDKAARSAIRILSNVQESSCAPEEKARPHIQATTDTHIESCSGSTANKQTARERADANLSIAAPFGAANCRENKHEVASDGRKPKLTDAFTPHDLYRMAGEGMRMYIDAHRQPADPLTEHDFIQAALRLAPALGIHESAVADAIATLGDLRAALAIMVIDANLNHPTSPIRKPGGALRAYTRLWRNGQFNLMGSLIGLKDRAKAARTL